MQTIRGKYKKSKIDGKITIKHFLNTRIKPLFMPDYKASDDTNEQDIEYYPIYTRVTVKRQSTSFPTRLLGHTNCYPIKYFDEEVKLIKTFLDREITVIEDVIKVLNPFERDDFDIKEFTELFGELYSHLTITVREKLIGEIRRALNSESVIVPFISYEYDYDENMLISKEEDFEDENIESESENDISYIIDWTVDPFNILNVLKQFVPAVKRLEEKYPTEVWNFGYFSYCMMANTVGIRYMKEDEFPYISLYEWNKNVVQDFMRKKYMPHQPEKVEQIIDGLNRLLQT